jgi:hypothetical protein
MCHRRGVYVLDALVIVFSRTPQGVCRLCRRLRRTALFRVQLPRLIIPLPHFVRALFRACDYFPEWAYEREKKSSQGKARLNATADINIQDHHPRGVIE